MRLSSRKVIHFASMGALLTLLSLLVSQSAIAQTTESVQQYDIELLVFSVTRPTASSEDWAFEESLGPRDDAPPDPEHITRSIEEGASTIASNAALQTFPALDATQLRLGTMAATLQRSSAYKVVAHFGWKQPGKSNDLAIPVSVSGLVADGTPLSGTVTLVRTRFLHLKVNLAYRAADGHRYVLREQRRIQHTGDKHYLDNPYFGVIATVTPSN